MARVLWVDDDLCDFPYVIDRLNEVGHVVTCAYSAAMGFEILEEAGPDAWDLLLLDAILPVGQTDAMRAFDKLKVRLLEVAPDRKYSDYRFSGFMLLDVIPKLAKKTVILSLVPEVRLRRELHDHPELPIVPKLGLELEDLHKAIERVLGVGRGKE